MKLLAIDLSTSCSGWSLFDIESKRLLSYGTIKPSVRGLKNLVYPKIQLEKMKDIAAQFVQLIAENSDISKIVIEEINKGPAAGRISQKVLDGAHWILLDQIKEHANCVEYLSSDGGSGWRDILKLRFTELDKEINRRNKILNKRRPKGSPRFIEVTKKTLAWRYVNSKYGLTLDGDVRSGDGDIADSIGLGTAALIRSMQ